MKKLLFVLVFLASPVYAQTTSYWGNAFGAQANTGAARYIPVMGNGATMTSTQANACQLLAVAGTVNKLWVALDVDPTNMGSSYSIRLQQGVNGAAPGNTAQICTVAAGATTCSDSAHPISVAAGDRLCFIVTPSGTPSAARVSTRTEFISTVTGETAILATGSGTTQTTGQFVSVFGPAANSTATASAHRIVMCTGGTITAFYWDIGTPPGVGTDRTMTIRKNSSPQAMTITFGAAESGVKSDTTNTFSVAAGDTLEAVLAMTGSPAASPTNDWGLKFTPTVVGQFCMFGGTRGVNMDNAAPSYLSIGWQAGGATESALQRLLGPEAVLSALYVNISGTAGAAKDYTFTLQDNASPASVPFTVTISGGTDTAGSITAQSFTPTTGHLFDVLVTPTSTPTARTATFSFLASVPSGGCGSLTLLGVGRC